jgi:hypothetical protein
MNVMRKESMESFRNYLNDTDGGLYVKLWMEVEQISTITDPNERAK